MQAGGQETTTSFKNALTNAQIILMAADMKSHMTLQLIYIPDLWFQTMHEGDKIAAKAY